MFRRLISSPAATAIRSVTATATAQRTQRSAAALLTRRSLWTISLRSHHPAVSRVVPSSVVGAVRRSFASDAAAAGTGADGPVTESKMRERLAALNAEHLHVKDTSGGCGTFFQVVVVSSQFEGKSLVACHRLVNDRLRQELPSIHGMQLIVKTPAQWKELQQQQKSQPPK